MQCHGCFDLVHPGHVRYLQGARQLGDVLVVSLTGDSDVNKGPDRPYIPQELRAENLAALEFVDWVVIDPHPTAVGLLRELQPDIYVKGREYANSADPRFLEEQSLVESYGGRVVFHSGDVIFSSTRLIRSLRDDEPLETCRLQALCARTGITAASTAGAIGGLRGLPVLVVGDALREEFVLCDAAEAGEDAPLLALRRIGAAGEWGGAARLALQLAALGARPVLATGGGRDPVSAALVSELTARGVTVYLLPIRDALPVRQTFVADDSKLLRVTHGGTPPPDSLTEKQSYETLAARLDDARALIWCDLGFGLATPGLTWALTGAAQRRGLLTAGTAVGPRTRLAQMRGVELLYCSERRLRDEMHDMGSGLSSVAWELLARCGGRRIIVSLHKRGLIGFDGRADERDEAPTGATGLPGRLHSEFVPALAGRFLDTFGRDEAVLALATGVLATGGSLPVALYLAAAGEALVVSRSGIAPPTATELLDWLATRGELSLAGSFVAQHERTTTPGEPDTGPHRNLLSRAGAE